MRHKSQLSRTRKMAVKTYFVVTLWMVPVYSYSSEQFSVLSMPIMDQAKVQT